ncbi:MULTISPECIES: toll/interleukin-1 receptor domain-containing protein [unclassified Streptomyces]|uniref:toll/interleukin-1 receptor domain-containing protein n=1 Tax=unclassified Streptomyces TaxID=2593676 RepID=UPI002E2BE0CF|nr:toll/interleukin-1 receptor domain-containing protein [Streptomyces sp. NBC_00228]
MASYFVTSYAAAENPSYAARFHDDLAEEVTRQLGRKIDARTCDPTVSAKERRRLVAAAGAFVMLWSSDYFDDDGCIDDWKLFDHRLGRVPAQRRPACMPTRVLVRWRTDGNPRPGVPWPRMILGDVMADYNTYGLYKVVRDQGPGSPAYRDALRQLARQVRAGLATPLPVLSPEDVSPPNPVLPSPRTTGSAMPKSPVPQPANPQVPAPPRALISYAHDEQDPEHSKEALSLAELLKREGIDVRFDQYVADEPQNWLRWMQAEMADAKYILTVASPAYRRRVELREKQGTGRGATWEAAYMLDEVYDNAGTWQKRFLRIVFPRFTVDDLPSFPGSASVSVYRIDPATGGQDFDRLVAYMKKGPSVP